MRIGIAMVVALAGSAVADAEKGGPPPSAAPAPPSYLPCTAGKTSARVFEVRKVIVSGPEASGRLTFSGCAVFDRQGITGVSVSYQLFRRDGSPTGGPQGQTFGAPTPTANAPEGAPRYMLTTGAHAFLGTTPMADIMPEVFVQITWIEGGATRTESYWIPFSFVTG